MRMNPPTLPVNCVPAVGVDELVRAMELIQHATAPSPNDGGHHEAAHELSSQILERVRARRAFELEQQEQAHKQAEQGNG